MLYLPAYGISRLEFLNVNKLPDGSTACCKRSVLFVKCMPSAPCYGPSLAYVDRKETNSMWATSIGRTAQTHKYHMLHEATWPIGVFAWQRILCQWNQSTLSALEPGILMTRACTLAAMGSKCPAHQRDPHPGYMNTMRLFMMALQSAQAAHYVKHVLIPACPGPAGDVARPFGLELTVTVEVAPPAPRVAS